MSSEEKKQILLNKAVIPVGVGLSVFVILIPIVSYIANLRSDINYLQNRVSVIEQRSEGFRTAEQDTANRVTTLEIQFQAIISSLNEIKETVKSL